MTLSTFIIDSREITRKRSDRVPNYIESYLPTALEREGLKEPVPILHKKLPYGDFAWTDIKGRCFICERKTYTDLLSSMNETGEKKMLREMGFEVNIKQVHKVSRQLYLAVKSGARTFLVLEGTPWVDDRGFLLGRRAVKSVESMMMRYELEGVQVWYTDSPQETAKRLVDAYLLCQRKSQVWPE